MLKHIVLWKLKEYAEGADRAANAEKLKAEIEALPAAIPAIKRLEVGLNVIDGPQAFDVALYTEFEDRDGLQAYLDHPEHVRVAEFLGKIRSERAVVDYEV